MKKIIILFCFVHSSVFADNITCKTGTNNLYAVFVPIVYNCDSGYFLPANTPGCQQCPDDYVCAGGTFSFDYTTAQGLVKKDKISHDASNACATNFPKTLYALYEPNTVTLNFDDNNGNTTSGSCTYDGLVNLPETPTREGYDFVGWKVENNNE